ncbi:redoxin domain-containing protein [Candidatus Bipolaricaulota bacterium]|nr:redoxin domain-containing protein [Candidatus Bipolaricaulota bacterium]
MRENRGNADGKGSNRRGLLFLVLILAGVGIGVGLSLQPSAVPAETSQPEEQLSHTDSAPFVEEPIDVGSHDPISEDPPDPQTEALLPEDSPSGSNADPASETESASTIPSGPRRTGVGYGIGQVAPGFSLVDLEGQPVSLSSYRGQVVLLDFWASWCSPCRQTLPHLHQLAMDFASEGLVFIGVNLDRRPEDAVSYLEDHSFHQMIPVQGTTAVAQQYGVSGIPRTFVIDRSGVIRFAGHPSLLVASSIEPWL